MPLRPANTCGDDTLTAALSGKVAFGLGNGISVGESGIAVDKTDESIGLGCTNAAVD
jgi:hypothetical protein